MSLSKDQQLNSLVIIHTWQIGITRAEGPPLNLATICMGNMRDIANYWIPGHSEYPQPFRLTLYRSVLEVLELCLAGLVREVGVHSSQLWHSKTISVEEPCGSISHDILCSRTGKRSDSYFFQLLLTISKCVD